MLNTVFIREFQLLVNQIKIELLNAKMDNDIKQAKTHEFRLKNMRKVLNTIKNFDFEITSVDDLDGISGIGPGTKKRIEEILETGKLSEIDNKYSDKKNKKIGDIKELSKVIGIGPKTAQKLMTKYKITSVVELKKAHKDGKIKLSNQILLGLKYYGIVNTVIPRKEITQIEKYLKSQTLKVSPDLQLMICGSYRRGKPTSGDIDVLLFDPEVRTQKQLAKSSFMESFIDILTADNFIIDNITDKNYQIKYMGFCKYKNNPVRRIDIRFVPYNSIYSAMLYFTGPYELNTEMRSRANKRNMTLNEYGLYLEDSQKGIEQIPINSEEDIFKKLGMKYLAPEEREKYSTGEK